MCEVNPEGQTEGFRGSVILSLFQPIDHAGGFALADELV